MGGLTENRLDSLGPAWTHLDSLGFTLDLPGTYLDSLGFHLVSLDSMWRQGKENFIKGKREHLACQKGKRESAGRSSVAAF